jgi:hypothetical protein
VVKNFCTANIIDCKSEGENALSWRYSGSYIDANVGTISAVYLSPKFTVKLEHLEEFYNTLGQRFIAGGDYNAKHTVCDSRLIATKGREVLKTIKRKTTYIPLHQ